MTNLLTLDTLDIKNKRLLIRSDLNVPVQNNEITSEARIQASLPTYTAALNAGAKVMVMSHLGRPDEGSDSHEYSLAPVARCLEKLLNCKVRLIKNWLNEDFTVDSGEIVLLENVRFNVGEKNNDEALSRQIASLCDIYVMDAFGAAHRAQASTYGAGLFAPVACAGPLLNAELHALNQALTNPEKPLLAVIGGAKVSTKLAVLESLASVCDQLIPGGGITNTFMAAAGKPTGRSLIEKALIPKAKNLMNKIHIPLPVDVVVAREFSQNAIATVKQIDTIKDDEMILDIGPETQKIFKKIINNSRTILWNGPMGVFEFDQFGEGTKAIANIIADSPAFTVAGGGDTLAAIEKYQVTEKISYISTGGGAFLEYAEGKKLPAVTMLETRNHQV